MEIQKYKATVINTSKEVVGYITEIRKYVGKGSYTDEIDYLISVTEISMPNGDYGTFKVYKDSIKPITLKR